jgi:hypothetical protein
MEIKMVCETLELSELKPLNLQLDFINLGAVKTSSFVKENLV